MKRSEMLKIIENSFDEIITIISTDSEQDIRQKRSEIILKHIESAGMLPPFIKHPLIPKDMSRIQHASRKAVERAHNYQHLPDDFEINKWEDE